MPKARAIGSLATGNGGLARWALRCDALNRGLEAVGRAKTAALANARPSDSP